MDFFLWGYVKDKVYKNAPKDLSELRNEVYRVIKAIPVATLRSVMKGFEKRLRMVIATEGLHIENILN